MCEEGLEEAGDDGGVGAVGVLAAAEDVKVAEADGIDVVEVVEEGGVLFVDGLGEGVGGEGAAGLIFACWEGGVVAVDGGAGGIDEAADVCGGGGGEEVHEAADIDVVGGGGVFDGGGDGGEGGVVGDVIDAADGAVAIV